MKTIQDGVGSLVAAALWWLGVLITFAATVIISQLPCPTLCYSIIKIIIFIGKASRFLWREVTTDCNLLLIFSNLHSSADEHRVWPENGTSEWRWRSFCCFSPENNRIEHSHSDRHTGGCRPAWDSTHAHPNENAAVNTQHIHLTRERRVAFSSKTLLCPQLQFKVPT